MRKVVYHEAAEQELLSEVVYLESRATGLGHKFLEAIAKAETFLMNTPEAAPEVRAGLRKRVIQSFPYSLVYSIESEVVLVLAVAHHKRRPLYWLSRAGE